MDAAAHAAIGAGNDSLAADGFGVAQDAVSDGFWMLAHSRLVADHPRNHGLVRRDLHLLPNFPFVLVLGVCGLDRILARFHLEHEVDDVAKRQIAAVRSFPTAPTDVVADSFLWDASQRM